jgi:hypothetical protein
VPSGSQGASPETCIPNIGPRERQKRLLIGVVGTVLGAATTIGLCVFAAARPFRLATFVPFVVGAAGFFQARGKT